MRQIAREREREREGEREKERERKREIIIIVYYISSTRTRHFWATECNTLYSYIYIFEAESSEEKARPAISSTEQRVHLVFFTNDCKFSTKDSQQRWWKKYWRSAKTSGARRRHEVSLIVLFLALLFSSLTRPNPHYSRKKERDRCISYTGCLYLWKQTSPSLSPVCVCI